MFAIVGILLVFGAVVGGFLMGKGHIEVLIQPAEMLIIVGASYSNWELSADRANSARRLLQQDGVHSNQVTQVRGFADQLPRVKNNPTDPSNRRVTILVKNLEGPPPDLRGAAVVDGPRTPATGPSPPAIAAPPSAPAVGTSVAGKSNAQGGLGTKVKALF